MRITKNRKPMKQKVLAIGRKYYIYDNQNQLIGFCHQKAFKWKEDIRIYTDESKAHELLTVKQQQVPDFSGTFAVNDPTKGNELVGFVGRKGWQSMLQDTWHIFNNQNQHIAEVKEEGGGLAILRRILGGIMNFIPMV